MKKIFVMLALTMGVVSANAQSVDSTAVTNTVAGDVTLTTDIYPQQEDGDIYHGLTKKLTFDRMIPPYGLEVTYDKTTHIIFPAASTSRAMPAATMFLAMWRAAYAAERSTFDESLPEKAPPP